MFRTSSVIIRSFYVQTIGRLWYVVIRVLLDTSSRYKVAGGTATTFYRLDVSGSTRITTYHSLHIEFLHKSSWGWTHEGPKHVELKPEWSIKNLLSETTLCISLDYIYIYIIRCFLTIIKPNYNMKFYLSAICWNTFYQRRATTLRGLFGKSPLIVMKYPGRRKKNYECVLSNFYSQFSLLLNTKIEEY